MLLQSVRELLITYDQEGLLSSFFGRSNYRDQKHTVLTALKAVLEKGGNDEESNANLCQALAKNRDYSHTYLANESRVAVLLNDLKMLHPHVLRSVNSERGFCL